ncbi:MAG: sugar phosphate isomerase/epimerase [Candidatus Bathyarchaeota archaeon]|nr:sugar phosphate isomerase/epimerase [Candidatus Bathyarchaeota archaeon]MDH5494138.1 sugar phosphate isomerase/epimerase [Candidatus Bathyarchaeota archaeon]
MAKADIGLSMLHCLGEPFSSLCQRLQEVTVNYVELIDDGWHRLDQERVKKLKEIGESQGLAYTLHAPFANINIAAPAEDMRNFFLKRLEKSMTFTRQLECCLMVFHPGLRTGISGFYPGVDWKTNIESVQKLLKLSRKHGVKIAIENVPEQFGFLVANVEQFSLFFNKLGEDIGLVLDVGHSNINGQTHAFIEAFGEKIVHVHAHDNDGKRDLHLGVDSGAVNWQQFAADIKKMRFEGIVMVESYYNIKESIATLQKLFT